MNKFLLGMIATFGIMEADLPNLATYQLIILIVTIACRWKIDENWKSFLVYCGIAQSLGVVFFGTNWADIFPLNSLPQTGIAVFVGIIASYPKELITKIKNFKIGKS